MTDDFDVEALLEAPYKPKEDVLVKQGQEKVTTDQQHLNGDDRAPSPPPANGTEGAHQDEDRSNSSRRDERDLRSEERDEHSHRRDRHRSDRSRSRRSRSPNRHEHHRSSRYHQQTSRDSYRSGGRREYRDREEDHYRRRSRHGGRSQSPPRDSRGRGYDDRSPRHQDERRSSSHAAPPPVQAPRSPSPAVDEDERDKRTVFVMQIAAHCRTRELAEFFMQAGRVRDARIISDRNSRRSKGVGYVEFYHVESVQKALALSGQRLHGVPLIVQLTEAEKNRAAEQANADSKGRSNAAHRLYVGSIHFDLTDDDLRQVFDPFGAVEFVQLQRDETGKSKGYAFVQYKEAADAQLACTRMNGFELAGRTIKVSPVISGQHGTQALDLNAPGVVGSTPAMGAHSASPFNKGPRADMDESDAHGIALSSQARAELMQKLAREPVPSASTPSTAPRAAVAVPPVAPTQCVLLKNMFDPEEETEPNWDKDIEDDVKVECSKYGAILHIHVEKDSKGEIYIKFADVSAAEAAVNALDRRWFAGKQVGAVYIPPLIYHSRFPKAAHGRV